MKIVIKESGMEMVVSKFIGTLTGDLTKVDTHLGSYWVDKNGNPIFIYDDYYKTLEVETEFISITIQMLGIQFKDLKKVLLTVFEKKLNIEIINIRFV
jgi:hypothetical protein